MTSLNVNILIRYFNILQINLTKTAFFDSNDILELIKEIFVALNKIKNIKLAIPDNLLNLKYEGSEEHIKKLEEFLDSFNPVKKSTEVKIVKKSKGLFFLSMFAHIGLTGFAGFLLYYLIKKRF